MKTAYPIVITKEADGYIVNIPDFDIMTQGESIADSIDMARDAISLMGVQLEDEEKNIPSPSDIAKITVSDNGIVTLVDVDFAAYRRSIENRAVRKNCTIPSWLNEKAENAGINFSSVLQKALKEELNITT